MDLSLPIFLAAVFVVNVVPAFMPPTWVLLVYYSLFYCIDPLYLAILAAIASMLGRIALAKWSGPLTYRFFHKSMASNAEYAREECSKHRSAEFFGSFLYALSPLPSSSIFIVAGAAKLRLARIAGGFFIGRLISYYLTLRLTELSISAVGKNMLFRNPHAWLLELLGLCAAIAVCAIDWRALFQRKKKDKKV